MKQKLKILKIGTTELVLEVQDNEELPFIFEVNHDNN